MKVDTVVTLANGKNYLLLLEDDFMEEDYFLSVGLDANNEPNGDYVVLKEIYKDGDTYAQKINNPVILNQLLEDYRLQYEDEYGK